MINIRVEQELDYKIVEGVIENAFLNAEFTDNQEHNLVNRLRKSSEFIPINASSGTSNGGFISNSLAFLNPNLV